MQQVADWLEKLGNTPSALPRTTSVFQSYLTLRINTSKRLVLRRSVIGSNCCER
jgi:hypothetical protein